MPERKEHVKNITQLILSDIQSILAIIYVLTVGVGMLFSYQKYIRFGINIFDYADIFYFLVAPFSDFRILLFSLASILFCYFVVRIDLYWQARKPVFYSRISFGMDKKPWFGTFRMLTVTSLFIYYLFLASGIYGKNSQAEVIDGEKVQIMYFDNKLKSGQLIGKTDNVVFLLIKDQVIVIPITSFVKEMQL
jgi:type IV secretory pathway VirB2 component (pilin)